ncbi:hypothetical protein LIER_43187 [Lithospermum erythrorhizon]|uniref:Uncharacterized protein n=1 Tax=Lithospermum erythrorhizon TaxID=34254 RepID=A0AAV3PLQ9_LITER
MDADLSRVLGCGKSFGAGMKGCRSLTWALIVFTSFLMTGHKWRDFYKVNRGCSSDMLLCLRRYIDVEIDKVIEAHVGEVMEVDKRSILQERRRYVRIKVKLDVTKPLKGEVCSL